jgi:hypothetical protein
VTCASWDDAITVLQDAIDKVERSKERWCETEVHRIAGEIALKSPAPDTEKAEKYFDRALAATELYVNRICTSLPSSLRIA